MEAFDEAASGLPVTALYALGDDYEANVAELSAAVFVAPYLFALLLDGPLLLWAERFERRRMLALGVTGMALSILGCAAAPNLLLFALAFGLFSPASGLACGIAQAMLIDAAPERREQSMTDWAMAGWLGDLCGPALFWVAHNLGVGFRWVFVCVALMALVALGPALLWGVRPSPVVGDSKEEEEDESLPWRETWRLLASRPELFLWLFAVSLCALLDELVAGLVGLRVHEHGASADLVGQSLLAFTLGGLIGLGALKLLLDKWASSTLLAASCGLTLAAYSGWLLVPPSLGSSLWLLVMGAAVAPHYPLAQARAYAALPERSTLVAAAAQPFTLVELGMPLLSGLLADRWGLLWGLLLLSAQPLGLSSVLVATARRGKR